MNVAGGSMLGRDATCSMWRSWRPSVIKSTAYKAVTRNKAKRPERQKRSGYREPTYPYRYVPEKY